MIVKDYIHLGCQKTTHTHTCPLCCVARRAAFFHFRNMGVLQDRVVSPVPNPLIWRTSGLHFIRPLPFDLSGLDSPTRRQTSRQHSSRGLQDTQACWPQQGGDPSREKTIQRDTIPTFPPQIIFYVVMHQNLSNGKKCSTKYLQPQFLAKLSKYCAMRIYMYSYRS